MTATRWNPPETPKLRTDLLCQRVTQGAGFIFKVRTPESQSVCLLHDVELSVLKLMNGKRTLEAIVKDSAVGGLPMTVPQLEQFLREVAAYKFIANADPLP